MGKGKINKQVQEYHLHKKIDEAMKSPEYIKRQQEQQKQYTYHAFACFILITVDYMFSRLGFKKKRVQNFLHFVSQSMQYVTEDETYFRELNSALIDDVGFDVLESLGIDSKWV